MKLHGQFGRDIDDKKSRKIMASLIHQRLKRFIITMSQM